MKTRKEKIYALIEQEGITSSMSNTRWKEVLFSLRGIPLSYRMKMLTHSEPSEWSNLPYYSITFNYVEPLGWGGPVPLLEVEWLEISTVESIWRGRLIDPEIVDHSEQVTKILASLKIPFAVDENVIRIYGHIR